MIVAYFVMGAGAPIVYYIALRFFKDNLKQPQARFNR